MSDLDLDWWMERYSRTSTAKTGAERSAAWRHRQRLIEAARAANAVQALVGRSDLVETLARAGMGATRRALLHLENVTRRRATGARDAANGQNDRSPENALGNRRDRRGRGRRRAAAPRSSQRHRRRRNG